MPLAGLARFSPPGRNRAAEILSARAAEIPFRHSFSPMGTNCSLFVMHTALFDAFNSKWDTFFNLHELSVDLRCSQWGEEVVRGFTIEQHQRDYPSKH